VPHHLGVQALADLHVAMGVHWTPGREIFLCETLNFHHVCTLEKMNFIWFGTRMHPGIESSSSATEYKTSQYIQPRLYMI
jgi:hypothetical protein